MKGRKLASWMWFWVNVNRSYVQRMRATAVCGALIGCMVLSGCAMGDSKNVSPTSSVSTSSDDEIEQEGVRQLVDTTGMENDRVKCWLEELVEWSEAGNDAKRNNAYENLLKYPEETAAYARREAKAGNATGLRAEIMKAALVEIYGRRVMDDQIDLSPEEWLQVFHVKEAVPMPTYRPMSGDLQASLIFDRIVEEYQREDCLLIPTIQYIDICAEGQSEKVFMILLYNYYRGYEGYLEKTGGGMLPIAVTLMKNERGEYAVSAFEQPMDGSRYMTSIQQMATTPESHQPIDGLSERLNDIDGEKLEAMAQDELDTYLQEYGMESLR